MFVWMCEDGTRNRIDHTQEGFMHCPLELGHPFYTLGCVHTTHMNTHSSGTSLLKSITYVASMRTELGLKGKYEKQWHFSKTL